MKKSFYILFFVAIVLVYACQNGIKKAWTNTEIDFKELELFLKEKKKRNSERILVIPDAGCTGCISAARYFFQQHFDDENLTYIFTNIADLKMFKQEVPKSLWHKENILVDSSDYILQLGIKSIYPLELRKSNNGNIQTVVFEPEIIARD